MARSRSFLSIGTSSIFALSLWSGAALAVDPPDAPSGLFGGFKLPELPPRTNGPECKPVLDAFRALNAAPHFHNTWTAIALDGTTKRGEEIVTEQKYYYSVAGQWDSLPIALAQRKSMSHEGGDYYACKLDHQETVQGQEADVYTFRAKGFSQGGLNDFDVQDRDLTGRMWTVRGTGLPLRFELNLVADPQNQRTDKQHVELRVDYANLPPPAGVR